MSHGLERVVVLGGLGAVGTMFADLLVATGSQVVRVDSAAPRHAVGRVGGAEVLQGDVLAANPVLCERLATADLAVLALPEPVVVDALPWVAGLLRPDAAILETTSVKSRVSGVLSTLPVPGEAAGVNPMFAPSLGIDGGTLAVVVERDGPRISAVLDAVTSAGGCILCVGADEHDRLTACTQVLTHAALLAVGTVLHESGLGAETLAAGGTPPFSTLLALLARMAGQNPDVYHDIQAAHPYAVETRHALGSTLRRLSDVVESGSVDSFASLLADSTRIATDDERHRSRVERLLRAISRPEEEISET